MTMRAKRCLLLACLCALGLGAPLPGCGTATTGPDDASAGLGGDMATADLTVRPPEPDLVLECSPDHCGNGVVEAHCSEQCDDKNNVNHDGCDIDCTYSCADKKPCPSAGQCGGTPTCQPDHTCKPGVALSDGTACGAGGHVCRSTQCVPTVCGDGLVTAPEECDDANTNPADGCDSCRFTCLQNDAQRNCNQGDPCRGAGTCDDKSHTCSFGAPLKDGAACGNGLVCKTGVCVSGSCGNNVVDGALGETCEPPGTATCDAACHLVPKCGNGSREAGEDCDDGNTTNLDGCDGRCRFEQVLRIDGLYLSDKGDDFCPRDLLGEAFSTALALSRFQGVLDEALDSGLTSMMLQWPSGGDVTGTSIPNLTIGLLAGLPQGLRITDGGDILDGGTYDPMRDLDWWYPVLPNAIDGNRVARSTISGSVTAKKLELAGRMSFYVVTHSGAAPIDFSELKIRSFIGPTSTPTASMGSPPGHLAAERLNPSLKSFERIGEPGEGSGQLCGRASAASLNRLLLPGQFTGMGLATCGESYTPGSTLLDMLVSGCTVLATRQVQRTQPDSVDPGAPVVGAGGPYTLVATNHRVTGCKDKSGAMVDLGACLTAASYTAYFRFNAHRVIPRQ